jgi:hypothetical protein
LSDFTDIYLNKLAYQFETSENFRSFIEAFLKQFEELNNAIQDVRTLRYLDTSEGKQLDNIGEIVGITRPFGYSDEDYRFLIKIQIMINNCDMTVDNTLEILLTIFGNDYVRYVCNTTLEAVYVISTTLSDIQKTMLKRIPRTLGIGNVDFQLVVDPNETFSFAEDPTGKGFGTITDPEVGGNFATLIT